MTTFLNLPGWDVTDVKQGKHDYVVQARYTPEPKDCPHCNQGGLFGSLYRHGGSEQLVMDLPSHGKRVGIKLYRRRYRCKNCLRTFPQPIPDVEEGKQMTRRLVRYIEQESIRRPFVHVASDVGMDEKTVRNVFKGFVAELGRTVTFATPEWLGLDELHLLRKPRLVATNLKERCIIAVEPNRDKRSVSAYLRKLDAKAVKVAAMDMWKPYRDAVRERMPNAVIVVDKFHVVRMANQCLDAVRKTIRAELSDSRRRRLMHERFLLLRRPKDLEAEEKLKLGDWLGRFPVLASAYNLKESFFGVFDAETKKDGLAAFQTWEGGMDTAMKSAYKPLLTAVYNWRDEIFAYFDHLATNACTEALNGIAKNINRNGRGYSFDAIRAKMLYSKTLQKEPRGKYTGHIVDAHTMWEIAPEDVEYLDPRNLGGSPLLGTDIAALQATLGAGEVVKPDRKRKGRSPTKRDRNAEDE